MSGSTWAWTKKCVSISYQSRQSSSRNCQRSFNQVRPVGIEGLLPPIQNPLVKGRTTLPGFEHHEVVVSAERHELPAFLEGNQLIEDTARVRPAIDVIAHRDDLIVGPKL